MLHNSCSNLPASVQQQEWQQHEFECQVCRQYLPSGHILMEVQSRQASPTHFITQASIPTGAYQKKWFNLISLLPSICTTVGNR